MKLFQRRDLGKGAAIAHNMNIDSALNFYLCILITFNSAPLRFTFLGTGTSQGIPVIACECEVCTSEDPRDKRLRTSGMVQSDTTTVVFDTGPDFRQQMLRHKVKRVDAVVFTHQHKDHTAGLDDVRAFNYLLAMDMPIYATPAVQEHLRKEYYYIFEQADYPGVPKLKFYTLDPDQPFTIGDISFTPIPVLHRDLLVLGFRMGDFAYVTDANFISPASMKLLEGLDTLVLNALRRKPHHSHFTLEEAISVSQHLHPRQTYLTHISHLMGTHSATEADLPSDGSIQLAVDGQILTI